MNSKTLFYILKRIGLAILTVWVVITVTFFVMHAVPGGPFMSEKAISASAQAALEAKYGLDKPLMQQYWTYLKDVVTKFDFGPSLKQRGRMVIDIIADGMKTSIKLGVIAAAVAGVVGNVIRTNASISGAECGCQAEIGSACSMTAAALASLYGLNIDQIEYAAEIAMEHNLGLTCDPVNGLVQIPCIERNAVAAMRAISSVNLSRFLYETRKISFDEVVATMYRTGKDMDEKYRETSHGGLAKIYYGNI